MEKAIYFDMDGTIADFYGVDGWLEMLRDKRTKPYRIARPLQDMRKLSRLLREAQKAGYTINIISWTAKNACEDFQTRIKKSKKAWLKRHLPAVQWDNIYIVEYGEPKQKYGNGILFDDDKSVRNAWQGESFTPDEIIKILKELI